MAVSTTSYFSNSIIGVPQVGADIDIYEVSTSPKYAVGFGFTRADGSKYRYAHIGADTNRAVLVGTDISESSQVDIDNVGSTVANLTKPAGEIINPGAIGSQYMQLVITATADQFAGAYITVTDDNGEGYTYRIKGNTATNNPVTGNCYVELYDKIVVAIDSNTDVSINGLLYANLEATVIGTSTDQVVAGVTVAGVSATNWAWIQTAGICGVLQDVTVPLVGQWMTTSTNTAGAASPIPYQQSHTNMVFIKPLIGYCVDPGDSTGHSVINLRLE